MNATIRKAEVFGEPRENPNGGGKLYPVSITLEDGTTGFASSTQETPWYAEPGTAVVLQEKGKTKNGKPKWSVKRPEYGPGSEQGGESSPQKPSNAPRKAPVDTRGIEVGQALNKAVDILIATDLKEEGLNPETFSDKLYHLAADIYRVGQKLRDSDEL